MGLIVALIIGGLIGWIAAAVMGRHEGIFASIAIGVVGAILGGWLSKLVGAGGQSYLSLSWSGVLWSFIGSVVLVAVLNAFSHRSSHRV